MYDIRPIIYREAFIGALVGLLLTFVIGNTLKALYGWIVNKSMRDIFSGDFNYYYISRDRETVARGSCSFEHKIFGRLFPFKPQHTVRWRFTLPQINLRMTWLTQMEVRRETHIMLRCYDVDSSREALYFFWKPAYIDHSPASFISVGLGLLEGMSGDPLALRCVLSRAELSDEEIRAIVENTPTLHLIGNRKDLFPSSQRMTS